MVTQVTAAKAALRRVEEEIPRGHVAPCVEHAGVSGDEAELRRKVVEPMDEIGRADRQAASPVASRRSLVNRR